MLTSYTEWMKMKYYYYTCVICNSRFYCDEKLEPLVDRVDGALFNWLTGCSANCRMIYEVGGMKPPTFVTALKAWVRWLFVAEHQILPVPELSLVMSRVEQRGKKA